MAQYKEMRESINSLKKHAYMLNVKLDAVLDICSACFDEKGIAKQVKKADPADREKVTAYCAGRSKCAEDIVQTLANITENFTIREKGENDGKST